MSQGNNLPPRRRINVQSAGSAVPPGAVAGLRDLHASTVHADLIAGADDGNTTFDPRAINRSPNLPTNQPAAPSIGMEDVAAAFARAGQKVEFKPNSNRPINSPNRPVNPPPEEILADTAFATPGVALNNPRITKSLVTDDPQAFRVELPSNNVFYQHEAAFLVPFDVPQLALLYRARTEKKESMLIDAVDQVFSEDARDLTPRDFRYLMYQLRIQSYLKNPYKLSYTSFYGNFNEFMINNTNLTVKVLDKAPDDYHEWYTKGLCMYTVRDQEEYNSIRSELGPDAEFYWAYARYVQGDSVRNKIAQLRKLIKEHGIDFMFSDISEFRKQFEDYGVTETVELQDNKFVAATAIERMQAEINSTKDLLEGDAISAQLADTAIARITVLQEDINRINTELQTGEAAPRRETIEFSIEIADFFPVV